MRLLPRRQRLHVVNDANSWAGLWRGQRRQLQVGQRVGVHQPGRHPELEQLRGVERRLTLRGADDVRGVRFVHRRRLLPLLLGHACQRRGLLRRGLQRVSAHNM
jgi:hypothetical protein